jgi:hypothetical protein
MFFSLYSLFGLHMFILGLVSILPQLSWDKRLLMMMMMLLANSVENVETNLSFSMNFGKLIWIYLKLA